MRRRIVEDGNRSGFILNVSARAAWVWAKRSRVVCDVFPHVWA